MNGSPIAAWDAAEAYYTFADRPAFIFVGLVLMTLITLGVIIHSAKHETKAFQRYP